MNLTLSHLLHTFYDNKYSFSQNPKSSSATRAQLQRQCQNLPSTTTTTSVHYTTTIITSCNDTRHSPTRPWAHLCHHHRPIFRLKGTTFSSLHFTRRSTTFSITSRPRPPFPTPQTFTNINTNTISIIRITALCLSSRRRSVRAPPSRTPKSSSWRSVLTFSATCRARSAPIWPRLSSLPRPRSRSGSRIGATRPSENK